MPHVMEDVYGERKAMAVREDTWGHLAPRPRKKYQGTILFAISEYTYQGTTVIRSDFADLPGSPWFYESMCEFINNRQEEEKLEEGHVYFWTGYYQFFKGSKKKNGRDRYLDESFYKFVGTTERVATPQDPP